MKNSSLALELIGGAVAGAAIALLLAPEKGCDTRKAISRFIKSHCPGCKDCSLDEITEEIAAKIDPTAD